MLGSLKAKLNAKRGATFLMGVGMRIGRIEIRLWLRPEEWTVELWQWPHQDVVKRDQVQRAFVGLQIGPVELGFWLLKPGQYVLVPQRAVHNDRRDM
jgi:hypothetical protein